MIEHLSKHANSINQETFEGLGFKKSTSDSEIVWAKENIYSFDLVNKEINLIGKPNTQEDKACVHFARELGWLE